MTITVIIRHLPMLPFLESGSYWCGLLNLRYGLCCHVGAVLNEDPQELHMTPVGCPLQWCPPILGLGCRIGTVLEEKPCEYHITPIGYPMQRCLPVLGLGCHVSAVLDEEPGYLYMTPIGRQM